MTPEIILIIILVVALAVCGLGWANAIKATPVGPRFEWDPKENCWVLKDCIRIDHDVVQMYPKFRLYINSVLRWKNTPESKPETEKAAKGVDC